MKKKMSVCLGSVLLFAATVLADNAGIHVYDPVPGLAASEFYSFRIRTVGSTEWLEPFAFSTRCKGKDAEASEPHYYTESLADWSNSYINFEMSNNVPVEVEITRLDGTNNPVAITKAVAHPSQKVDSCTVTNGKAYVVFDNPALFTVDINGQMDDQDTARIEPDGWSTNDFYSGPPIHTLTVFANPFIQDKPSTNDTNVYLVATNEIPPDTGTWDTLYFEPGVHEIGRAFPVHANKKYYIPGDAVVHGTFYGTNWTDGHDIRIYGHGTLSGERIPHPDDDIPPAPEEDVNQYRPIQIVGARDTTVEGITLSDSAFHSIMLVNSYAPETPTDIRWVKIFTWRGNGDGINPFGNGLIEDCFIRTADDCTYVNGRGIRRCVFWTDVNGSAFTMTPIGGIANPDLVIEDCDIIYNRSRFTDGGDGGRVFNMRGAGSGEGGTNVTFRNIRISDPRSTRSCFAIQTASSYVDDPNYSQIRGDGDIVGIRFENISIAAPSILGYPETLWGNTNAWIRDCIFENVTMAGVPFDELEDFNHNEYVTNLLFLASVPKTNEFQNLTGDGKWNTATNWDVGAVPTLLDLAKHTSVATVLHVDSAAYAGDLLVGHNNTSIVQVASGGNLTVGSDAEIGNAGTTGIGKLVVDGGNVYIGGDLELGVFGSARQGIGELNFGGLSIGGITALGGWNAGAQGTMSINGGTCTATNNIFQIGRTGNGTLNVTDGTLQLQESTGLVWDALRVGTSSGNGMVNLSGGEIRTGGIIMDQATPDAGTATVNLNAGLLQVEGAFSSAIQMYDDAQMAFDAGVLKWKGNVLGAITNFVAGGFITWTNGMTNMPTEAWEYSWTNGNSILFADYNDANAGYTTVWAYNTNTITPPTINILFLGNSFTYRHEIPQLVKTVFEEGHPEWQINTTRLTYGGKNLFHHHKMYHSETKLREGTVTAAEIEAAIADIQYLYSLSEQINHL